LKSVELSQARLESCVADAQQERIVVTRNGKPVALVIGLDEEQQQLGSSQKFWDLVAERRGQPTVSRAELERRLKKVDASGT
jgi:antitoxin (DNA-binding transcriptional repressor) of toxin-antitoxin stability system